MYKIIVIVGIIPIIINILLFILPFKEKGKNGVVNLPKSTFLFFPIITQSVFGAGLFLCLITCISDGKFSKDEISTFVLCLFAILLSIIPEIYYFINVIKYDSNRLCYRKKWYNFSEIETFGYDKKNYTFVTKTGEKIKIDLLSVGFDNLYKAYNDFKKQIKNQSVKYGDNYEKSL